MSTLPITAEEALSHASAFDSLPDFVKTASIKDRGWDDKDVWRAAYDNPSVPEADNVILNALCTAFCTVFPVPSKERDLKFKFMEAMMQRLEWSTPYYYGANAAHIDRLVVGRKGDNWFNAFVCKTNRYHAKLLKAAQARQLAKQDALALQGMQASPVL